MFDLKRWQQTGHDANGFQLPLHLENLKVIDTTGTDLIENGNFTNNFNYWHTDPDSNNIFLLDNFTSMDGGCLKVHVDKSNPIDTCSLESSNFGITSGQTYQLSFSDSGIVDDFLWSDIKENSGAYNFTNFTQAYPIDTFRRNFKTVFTASENYYPVRLDLSLSRRDSIVWFDNIHLFPVSATVEDSSEISKLFYNWSDTVANISLNGINYQDISGTPYSGTLTLQPYTFIILIQQNAFVNSTADLLINSELSLFPNPIKPGEKLYFNHLSGNNSFNLFDVRGNLVFTSQLFRNSVQLPLTLSPGFYISQTTNNHQVFINKIIVIQ